MSWLSVGLFFGLAFSTSVASAQQCFDLFKEPIFQNKIAIRSLFAGQSSIGIEYAFFKALRDAGYHKNHKWDELSDKDKSEMIKSLMDELETVPVIIDPLGRVFSVDQHHDMYALLALIPNAENPYLTVKVLRDFRGMNEESFLRIVLKEGLIYRKNIKDILDNPRTINQLVDSIERSAVGMAFALISKQQGVAFKGKYFSPFIQFLLADFVVEYKLMSFSQEFNYSDAVRVANLLKNNKRVRVFMREHLLEKAPKDLVDFLN